MAFEKKKFEPLPEGEYLVRMNRFEVKPTKKGGSMVSAGFQIINGDFKNRLLFHNFIIDHDNPKVVQIGNEQLTKYLKAVGYDKGYADQDPTILDKYTELPLLVAVKTVEREKYGPENKITTFKTR